MTGKSERRLFKLKKKIMETFNVIIKIIEIGLLIRISNILYNSMEILDKYMKDNKT